MFSEILVIVVSLGFSLFLFIISRTFPPSTQAGVPSAAFFPGVVAALIFLLSMAQVIRMAIRLQRRKKAETPVEKTGVDRKNIIRIIEIVLLMLLYSLLWIFNLGHFLINSFVIFFVVSILYGGAIEREWWKTLIFIAILVGFTYCLFKFVLKVPI